MGQTATADNVAQQIRDPQAGRFTARAFVCGDGSSREDFDRLFANPFRCRLIFFRFNQPSKSARERTELASVEFVPSFRDDGSLIWQTIKLEAMLAPTPGGNFTFGLGVGVALLVERKSEGPLVTPSKSEAAFVRLQSIEFEFEGFHIG